MKELTLEQKAIRYDYIEKALKEKVEHIIECKEWDNEPWDWAVEELTGDVDNILGSKIYFMVDQIIGENFDGYAGIYNFENLASDITKKERAEFLKEIGEQK